MTRQLRTGMFLSAALLAAQLGFAANHAGEAAEKRLEREVRPRAGYFALSLSTHCLPGGGLHCDADGKGQPPHLKTDAEMSSSALKGLRRW